MPQQHPRRNDQVRRSIFTALAAGGVVIGLVACGGVAGNPASTQPTGTSAPPESTATSAPDSETPTPTDEPSTSDATVAFGKAFTWENGVSATVSAPKAYRRSDTGFGGESFKHAVQFTIVNKSGKAFDPSTANATVQSGDVEGDEIFDSAHGINGSPDTKILDGRQARYKVAFGVSNPKDIVFEFTPGFEHDSAIWAT
ncbi:hypothetical protein AB0L64_17315 [Kribbella sp. NPDC051936]|uniref:hypothetical protein n=1 Tax=Kribbella sp. NPDC051936 TaxID=3154946 RepID=UPI00343DD90B